MRGAIAAACAAVLVGLASPGAFACASFAAVRCAVERDSGAQQQRAVSVRAGAGQVASSARRQRAPREAGRAITAGEPRAIWRAPSGPAPSRAPPARA